MSLPKSDQLTCVKCGTAFPITYWASVNVTLNPELRDEVLNGKIRTQECPSCGQSFFLNLDLLYHDMQNKFMISFHAPRPGRQIEYPDQLNAVTEPEGTLSEEEQHRLMMDMLLAASEKSMADYRRRIVTSWNQLKEKILIFEAGLEDGALEIIKIGIGFNVFGAWDFEDDRIYYTRKHSMPSGGEALVFEAYEGGQFVKAMPFPMDIYSETLEEAKANVAKEGETFDDSSWKVINQACLRPGPQQMG